MKPRLLLTGGSGLLGRAVSQLLNNQGKYNIKAPGREIFDLTELDEAIKACRNIDIVIHAAGLVLSRIEQQKRPAEVLFQNLSAALNIAQAAQITGVKKIIFVSSITAYGSSLASSLKEKDFWQGSPSEPNFHYGLAKRMTDIIAEAFATQYKMQTCCVVFPNLYGPADKFNFNPPPLVASTIAQIYKAKQLGLKVFRAGNNGHQSMDLLYVNDAALAIKRILQMKKMPKLINVGSGKSVKIAEIFRLIAEALNFKGRIVWQTSSQAAINRHLGVSLMKKALKWSPQIPLEQGIKESVKWYLNYMTK